jgi:membrane-bound lytic murein transglycosylase D
MQPRPIDTPVEAAPVKPRAETAVVPPNTADEAILSARAHQAAGEMALRSSDAVLARQEFESGLRVLQEGGSDARLAEVSAEISDQIRALDAVGAALPEGEQEQEPEPGEVEPSPLDELGTATPQLTPGQIEQERSLLEYGGLKFGIPFVANDRVIAWVDFFTNRNREKFVPGLIRSGRYISMIQRIFAEEGVPIDLAYMAHIESAYKPNAYSRAKAKGIFQFILATGRRYGLHVDSWVDERSDPEKAARAAASYLKDLYGMFGDWYLAMAAYNAGEGKVGRAIDRTGERDFWKLAAKGVFRNETVNYVPAILAAMLISKDPRRFGFDFEYDPPIEYETVRVEGPVHLKVIARCAGTDLETMQRLNPALRRRQTPPGTTDVRVPLGTSGATLAALAEVPSADRALVSRHVVGKGETLARIARRYGVRVSALQQANRMGKRTVVRPGETLILPGGQAELADATEDRPASHAAGGTAYRVRSGDTLSSIAKRFHTSPSAIASASGVSVHRSLHIGDRLTIPGRAGASAGTRQEEGARRAGDSARVVHTVRRGETLRRIADRYRVTVDRICALNDLTPGATLYPGKRLTIE